MSYTYSDMDSRLSITREGNVKVVYDEDAIIQSIKTILTTITGERVRNPIGSSLVQYLFRQMTPDTADDIRRLIRRNITQYEPRVTLNRVQVTPLYDQNRYELVIDLLINEIDRRITFRQNLRPME